MCEVRLGDACIREVSSFVVIIQDGSMYLCEWICGNGRRLMDRVLWVMRREFIQEIQRPWGFDIT
jgi:hypothetical protein